VEKPAQTPVPLNNSSWNGGGWKRR